MASAYPITTLPPVREYVFDRFEADLAYTDQRTGGNVALWSESLQVLTVAGELPLNLSFNAVEERTHGNGSHQSRRPKPSRAHVPGLPDEAARIWRHAAPG